MTEQTADRECQAGRSRILVMATLTLCVLHVAAVLWHYPLSSLRSRYPLMSGDLPLHFSAAHVGQQSLKAGGGLWGYAPDYMAGYPFGAWDSFTQRGYEYCTLLFPGLPLVSAFHAYLIVTSLLPPFLIGLAAWVLKLGRVRTLLSLCVAVVLYQLDDTLSYFWTFGNMGFPFANALGVLYLACLARGLRERRGALLGVAGLLLAAVGWLHQMAALPVIAGSLWIVAGEGRELFRERRFLWALLPPLLAAALLAPWLRVFWHFREFRIPRETPALAGGWKTLVMDFLSDRAYRHHFDRRSLFHAQFVLAVLGGLQVRRGGSRGVFGLLATGLTALGFAYFFSYSDFLKETEPYRYVLSFTMLAAIPAAVGLARAEELLRGLDSRGRLASALLAVLMAPSLAAYALDLPKREAAQLPGTAARAVLDWFRTTADRTAGRVLCLDESLGDVLPHFGGHAVLGGGMTRVSPLPHKAAWAAGYELLMEPTVAPSAEDVDAYLRRYNVAYIVLPSGRWDALMAKVPGCAPCLRVGPRRVYARAVSELSYVVGREGDRTTKVDARMNLILVRGAPEGRFVLKFHYQDTLRAPPGVRLFPSAVPEDPVPFLGVDNFGGVGDTRIWNGPLRGPNG